MNKNIFLFAFMLLCSVMVNANDKKGQIISTSFEVSGVCGMCEERIEKALDVKGVKVVDYDLETHILYVTYNSKHIQEKTLHELLNAVGHDTERSKATEAQYDTVHHCCKYREHEDH